MAYAACVSRALACLPIAATSRFMSKSLWWNSKARYGALLLHPQLRLFSVAAAKPVNLLWPSRRHVCQGCASAMHTSNRENHPTSEIRGPSVDSAGTAGEFELVYTGPLKGAVKALKIFSLTTAILATTGGPILVWLGNESVPLAARIALSSLVMFVGLSTTAILHWLLKGYVIYLHYNAKEQRVAAHTLSVMVRRTRTEFSVEEIRPPTGLAGFSTFQALGKSFFMHTDVFPDKLMLTQLLKAQSSESQHPPSSS